MFRNYGGTDVPVHNDLLLTMIGMKTPKIKFSDEALRLQTPNMAKPLSESNC